jgi:hypothetical protein
MKSPKTKITIRMVEVQIEGDAPGLSQAVGELLLAMGFGSPPPPALEEKAPEKPEGRKRARR